ncbi:hypothetical protein [Desulfosporosinus metallidurans]|uniref:IS110 family transposase n=1 Tax=Desulfosporosinus metallidurans TaxID=1888891 RepID=A0A1Q8QIQ9_9FIRM|nr:hypothetical protein [Desulfosporosinus metallidurans]OLN27220.1 hypothetical protein DSOL_4645 [Desulfosporosinus metallidurans]
MHHIGIDLAWTYAKESGICVIDDNGMIVYCESKVFSDEMIAAIVEEYALEGQSLRLMLP